MKGKIFSLVFGAVAISTLLFASGVDASSFGAGNNPTVNKGDVLDSSLYVAGENITVQGTVKGDVYCAGQNIEISGTVEGDVLCAGQNLKIDGKVNGNVRVAGQVVSVSAVIGQSATVFGQSVTMANSSDVAYDATIFASSISLSGKIGRDVVGGASSVYVTGNVGRDADLGAEVLTLGANSNIGGNLVYTSKSQVVSDTTAHVGGVIEHKFPEESKKANVAKSMPSYGDMIAGAMFGMLAILAIGALLMWIAPGVFKNAANNLQQQPIQTFGWGFVAMVCIPVAMIVLIITIIGIPLAFMLCAACFIWAMVSHAIASYALGGWMSKKLNWSAKVNEFLTFALGLLTLSIVSIIPIIGMIVSMIAWICGFGAIVLTAWRWRFGGKKVKPNKA